MIFCPGSKNSVIGKNQRKLQDMTELSTNYVTFTKFQVFEFAIGRCFMMVMANRTRATLENEIANYILHGSHIISDGWAAYAHIDQMQSGVYIQINFNNDRLTCCIKTQQYKKVMCEHRHR
jgi:hypothetical protein